jgi:hypothetical protein
MQLDFDIVAFATTLPKETRHAGGKDGWREESLAAQ